MSFHWGRSSNGVGSYYGVTPSMYQTLPAGTPGWELAPVPGWGMNPERSGPPVLAMNGSVLPRYTQVDALGEDSEEAANQGYIALAAAGGLFLGMFLAWAFWFNQGYKKRI